MRLLLASTSPRRSDLLRAAGIEFDCVPPGPEPKHVDAADAAATALFRARSKAGGARLHEAGECVVLGSDTVVELEGVEFGKPRDRVHAASMLADLAGRVHRVYTAAVLIRATDSLRRERIDSAEVEFAPLDLVQIEQVLDAECWHGKAGAYGLQDPVMDRVARLRSGAFDTVVGLHVEGVQQLLAEFAGR